MQLTRRDAIGRLACLAGYADVATAAQSPTEQPPAANPVDPFKTLRPAHPRLLLLDTDLDRIKQAARENSTARRCYGELEKEADRLLSTPPVDPRSNANSARSPSRRVLDRVMTLALMYRLTAKDPWLRRAIMELKAAANFRDWNPTRFIDCAEMTLAFAIGYDWLYPVLSADERLLVSNALRSKGLDPARPIYLAKNWWTREKYHWNIVCNAAMMIGALALAEPTNPEVHSDSGDKSVEIARAAAESIVHGLSTWSPDGGWPEGPGYGEFAARYTALFFASLSTALGSDLGLGVPRGFDRYGRFRLHTTGPTGRVFNWGDGMDDPGTAPEQFWLAKHYNAPVWAWQEQRQMERTARSEPLDLAWFTKDARPPQQTPAVALDAVFAATGIATFRSAWDDPNALFFAIKAGDNKIPHAHPDLGTFVLDAGGVRWALDDPYDDASQVGQRNARARTENHNTLLVDRENQDPKGEARIIRQEFGPEMSWVQLDLSKANPKLRQWTRRAGMVQRRCILIEDVVRADQPIEIVWGLSTDAEITVNGPTALLRKNGWILSAEIRTPRHAIFDIGAIRPGGGGSATQAQQLGIKQRLVVRLLEKIVELNLSISLTPYREGQPKPHTSIAFPA